MGKQLCLSGARIYEHNMYISSSICDMHEPSHQEEQVLHQPTEDFEIRDQQASLVPCI